MGILTLTANGSQFQRKIEWIVLRLESEEIRERLGSGLIDRLWRALAGGKDDEVGKLGRVTSCGPGSLMVEVETAGVLDEVFTALRTLGFEFHEQFITELDQAAQSQVSFSGDQVTSVIAVPRTLLEQELTRSDGLD